MDAEQAYGNAFDLLHRLAQDSPGQTRHLERLAAIHYHRGLLRTEKPGGSPEANADFRESIRLLEPLAARDRSSQDLARVYGSLGSLLGQDPERSSEAQVFWEKAIGIDERLLIKDPGNREARLELARFCNSLAALLGAKGDVDEADRRSRMALGLLDSLVRAAPPLEVEQADAHRLRGLILQGDDPQEALAEYEEALDLFEPLLNDHELQRQPAFHQRYADLLLNLAAFPPGRRDTNRAQRLLSRGASLYTNMAGAIVVSGTKVAALNAAESVARMLPSMPMADQAVLSEHLHQLQRKAAADGAR
jgi:tetratricopeptide (TPR) repeat protein